MTALRVPFDMPSIDSIFETIRHAARRSDSETLRSAAYDLETSPMYGNSAEATQIVERVIQLLQSSEFQAASGAWHVLFALRNDLDKISEENRRRLFVEMTDAYDSFGDWMPRSVTSELAEYFATSWALEIVRNRLATTADNARQHLPHAFEHIARSATDAVVAREAFDSLVSMLHDESANVRDEDTESDLAQLAKKIVQR